MQKKLSGPVLLLFSSLLLLPGYKTRHEFDVNHFNKLFKTVEWLYDYDLAYWITSDHLTKQNRDVTGEEHFCYQDRDSVWHVIYGKTENRTFVPDHHLTVDTAYNIKVLPHYPGRSFMQPYVKSLHRVRQAMTPVIDSLRIRFNFYIRKNSDGTFTVWAFPGMQDDGTVIYGAEFMFLTDPAGKKLLKTKKDMTDKIRGYSTDDPPGKIMLDYEDVDEPTLGGILFVWENKDFFPKILLVTAKNISTVLKDHTGQYYWIHLERK